MLKRVQSPVKNSFFFFLAISFLSFTIIINLFYMQIVNGSNYLFDSKNIYANFNTDRAQRGIIYDRNGIKLVDNIAKFKVYIQKSSLDNPELQITINNLESVFNIDIKKIFLEEYNRVKDYKNINEVKIFSNIDYNPYIFQVEANPEKFPLIKIEKYMMRKYLYPELISHIVGYTSEITSEDYAIGKYQYGDEIGKYGVEKGYDEVLRGQNGIIRSDFYGATRQNVVSNSREKINGKDIYLTIDIKYQKKLYELIEQNKLSNKQFSNTISFGVVVQDVSNGEILAMASYPTFDANLFVMGISQEKYKEYIENPGKPLSNKATQYSQSPGSTFKIMTDLVALNEGAITKDTIYEANGTFEFGGVVFQDAGRTKYGNINMSKALCVSSNIYHMKAALALNEKSNGNGSEIINKYFEEMGLNKVSGINIGSESIGYYPTKKKMEEEGKTWFTGYLMNSSIGQGEVRLSPLSGTQMTSIFANRGKVISQKIVKDDNHIPEIKTLDIKPKVFSDIEEGMQCATELNNGYLGKKTSDYPTIGVKTGSAETGQVYNGREVIHGWEVSYGPLQKPHIAMSIFMENAAGGWKGGYISREFFKYYTEQNP